MVRSGQSSTRIISRENLAREIAEIGERRPTGRADACDSGSQFSESRTTNHEARTGRSKRRPLPNALLFSVVLDYDLHTMATTLSVLALIVLLLVIASVSRWVFQQGGGLLAAFVTLFLIIFATVSFAAATLYALTSTGMIQLLLLISIIVTAIFVRIAWA
jgi:hypothetical protein